MSKKDSNNQYPSLTLQDELTDFLLYTAPNSEVKVEVLLNNETIWLTQKRMAELFGVGVPAISKHLKNIFDSGELQQKVVISILENTTEHGAIAGKTQTTATKYYNLDAVISVGYRVNSAQATQFRKWAMGILQEFTTLFRIVCLKVILIAWLNKLSWLIRINAMMNSVQKDKGGSNESITR